MTIAKKHIPGLRPAPDNRLHRVTLTDGSFVVSFHFLGLATARSMRKLLNASREAQIAREVGRVLKIDITEVKDEPA